jgi:hypothetical protein
MKIYIGPYKNWIGPYQIAEKLLFWLDPNHDRVFELGTWLAETPQGKPTLLARACNWVERHRKRTTLIRIDHWDTWNMDHTLALIALPMLRQLQESKHGAPYVDDADVPEHLRSTSAAAKENDWDVDEHHFARWDWVMAEMIFAFECELDDSWQEKYWRTKPELDLESRPEDAGQAATPVRWKTQGDCDHEGLAQEQQRIDNGFRLFGRYYQALWD